MRALRYLFQAFVLNDSPRQLAMGLAAGIAAGLLPKDNLAFLSMAFVIMLARVNLATAVVTAVVVTRVGGVLDPIANSLGHGVLSFTHIQPTLAQLYSMPWMAWSGLDNTVVVGSLLIGLVQLYFSFCLAKPIFAWTQSALRKLVGMDAMHGTELTAG